MPDPNPLQRNTSNPPSNPSPAIRQPAPQRPIVAPISTSFPARDGEDDPPRTQSRVDSRADDYDEHDEGEGPSNVLPARNVNFGDLPEHPSDRGLHESASQQRRRRQSGVHSPWIENSEEEGANQLASALHGFSTILSNFQSSGGSPKSRKVNPPETFSGTDPGKLRTFIAQCELVFAAKPSDYTNDRDRTLFVLSYL